MTRTRYLFVMITALCLTAGMARRCAGQSAAGTSAPPANGQAASGQSAGAGNPGGGSATGPIRPGLYSADHVPITKSGFVDSGTVVFKDITVLSGLSGWHHTMGTPEKPFLLETIGSGVALLDYDNDGWLDIYLVNGATYDSLSGKTTPPHAALFHNNHDGTFTDVAEKAGVQNDRWGYGVAVGDYDNDGWPDLYVTNFGKNRLYHNNHDGTFTDVAEKAGVTLGNWSTGPTFGDYDGDGLLDIFVPGYVHWDLAHPPSVANGTADNAFCQYRGIATMCGPRGLLGEPDHLFHNNGDGTFTDVSEKTGVADKKRHYGFSSVFVDLNGDGKVDLLVSDDSSPNYLYINKGDGTFEDDSYATGFAVNGDGRDTATMGIALGDFRNNGLLDIYTTTFSDDYKVLYSNEGDANLTDITSDMGMSGITYQFLGWGTAFVDYDNDGWKDLFFASGHVYPQADKYDWGTSFAERPLLFHNELGKKFTLVPAVKGSGLAVVVPARGAAFGDLFNDGKIDVVLNCIDHTPVLLRNVNPDSNHWVGLKLVGGPKSPRDAVGSTVYLTAGGIKQRGDVVSGGSFESSSDQRLHFGLGEASNAVAEIHWPDGVKEQVKLPGADRYFVIEEGKGIVPSVYDHMIPAR
jgi:hypothetical protein